MTTLSYVLVGLGALLWVLLVLRWHDPGRQSPEAEKAPLGVIPGHRHKGAAWEREDDCESDWGEG